MWGSGATNAMATASGKQVYLHFLTSGATFFPLLIHLRPSASAHHPVLFLTGATIPTANEGQTLYYLHACVCVKKTETDRGGECVSVRACVCVWDVWESVRLKE